MPSFLKNHPRDSESAGNFEVFGGQLQDFRSGLLHGAHQGKSRIAAAGMKIPTAAPS